MVCYGYLFADLGEDWKELYSTTALVSPQVPEESYLDLINWNSSGTEFALGSQSEVYIIKFNSWEILKTLKIGAKVKKLEFSSSNYLAVIDENGLIYVFDKNYTLLLKRVLDNPICDSSWHPTENGMLIVHLFLNKGRSIRKCHILERRCRRIQKTSKFKARYCDG